MSGLYDAGREGFLAGDIAWDTDDIRAILIDTADYTVNLATHDNLDDVPSAARVAVTSSLASKTTTGGVANAAGASFLGVNGDQSEAIVIYKHTGTESTSRLVAYIDTFTSGMPVTPNGGDISVAWSTGTSKIFRL
jgi:hypothetical protein